MLPTCQNDRTIIGRDSLCHFLSFLHRADSVVSHIDVSDWHIVEVFERYRLLVLKPRAKNIVVCKLLELVFQDVLCEMEGLFDTHFLETCLAPCLMDRSKFQVPQ